MKPCLTTSPIPATSSARGRVFKVAMSQTTPAGVEGADEVLALGGVDAGLAAHRGIDHPDERGRHLDDSDPRSQVAAIKPATSVTAPPPTPMTASERVNPA